MALFRLTRAAWVLLLALCPAALPGRVLATQRIDSVRELRGFPRLKSPHGVRFSYILGPGYEGPVAEARIAKAHGGAAVRVVEGGKLSNVRSFKTVIGNLAKETDVLVFVGHSSPITMEAKYSVDTLFQRLKQAGRLPGDLGEQWPLVRQDRYHREATAKAIVDLARKSNLIDTAENAQLDLDAGVLLNINFAGAVVVFNGCFTGATTWRDDMMPRRDPLGRADAASSLQEFEPGTAISAPNRLLEAALEAKASMAIGTTIAISKPFDVPAFLAASGGEHLASEAVSQAFLPAGDNPKWRSQHGIDACVRAVIPK